MKDVDHPNICKLYQVKENMCYVALVMEYCPRGDLHHYVVKQAVRTPGYFAPEIVQTVRYNLPATDVWSIGVALYFMLSGVGTRSLDNRGMHLREYMLQAGGKYTLPKNRIVYKV